MGYAVNNMYYGGIADSGMVETSSGITVNWLLIGVIAGGIILGIVFGVMMGKRTMRKRDI